MFSPFDPFQACLVFALRLSVVPRSEAELSVLCGKDASYVAQALSELARDSVVRRRDDAKWTCSDASEETMRCMAETLREKTPVDSVPYCLSRLSFDADLDDCEYVLSRLDKTLEQARPESLLCLEYVLYYLLRRGKTFAEDSPQKSSQYVELALVAQSMCLFQQRLLSIAVRLAPLAYALTVRYGNERFRPLLRIFNSYLGIFSDEPLPRETTVPPESLEQTIDSGDGEFRNVLPLFSGILHYVRGEYPQVVKYFEQKKGSYHWKYRRFSDLFDSCASQSAFYLGQHHISLGIIESLRSTAALAGDAEMSLFWQLHLAFAQLRMGCPETALPNLDCLFLHTSTLQFNKTAHSALRGIALYHFLTGNIKAAHTVLRSHIGEALRKDLPYVPFEDPLNLDMMYCFEQCGYASVPRYELEDTLEQILNRPNKQLRGAGLRIEALRAMDRGLPPRHAAALLKESIALLASTEAPRETALSNYILAQALDADGKGKEAAGIRLRLRELSAQDMAWDLPYYELVRLMARTPVAGGRLASQKSSGKELPRRAGANAPEALEQTIVDALPVAEACRKAFAALASETQSENILHRLVAITLMELKAERGALFSMDDALGPIPAAAINLTRVELESVEMREVVDWLAHCAKNVRRHAHREGRRLCFTLDAESGSPWLLYLDNTFTDGAYATASPFELHVLAMLFAAEVRSALRLQRVRDEESCKHQERLSSMTELEDKHIAPVFSSGINAIVTQAGQVSKTDASVLIQGETGVGKEIMARHIHQLSRRKGPFVAVHPASTPENLFESEFFGHERGAFTGAIRQKIGFFEMADAGTLFIDEVGDVPPAIQTKLLRVLQEQRFMRVGGTREIRSQFRLIAATNKDLQREVCEGRFREDLLYRINVVPLSVPPLRERRQDILALLQFFLGHFARKYNRRPLALSREHVNSLYEYDWPGNIRELKNVIERAVILNNCRLVEALRPDPKGVEQQESFSQTLMAGFPTLDALEKQYLQHALRHTAGKICGKDGLEGLLQLKRSTLYAKLKRHAIPLR